MKLGNWLAILGCVGVAAGLSMSAQGCTATVNTGSGAQGDDDGTTVLPDGGGVSDQDSASTPPSACLDCLYGKCSGDYTACVNDLGCRTIYECATATACASDTTGACVTQCIAAGTTASQDLYENLGICDLEAQCNGGACAATCTPTADYCAPVSAEDAGGAADDGGSTADDAAAQTCEQCQQSSCATEYNDCQTTTSACATYNTCVLGCQDADCVTACQTNNPAGYTAAQSLGTCTSSNCAICSQ